MEHRYSRRTPVDMAVVLRQYGNGTIKGRATNISDEGMYVATQSPPLLKGSPVEVEFRSRQAGKRRLQGIVVHKDGKGVGVMFSEPPLVFERQAEG